MYSDVIYIYGLGVGLGLTLTHVCMSAYIVNVLNTFYMYMYYCEGNKLD